MRVTASHPTPVPALLDEPISLPTGSDPSGGATRLTGAGAATHRIADHDGFDTTPGRPGSLDEVLMLRPRASTTSRAPAAGTEQRVSREDFDRQWSGVGAGFCRYMNVFAPAGTALPPSRFGSAEAAMASIEGLSNTVNGLARVVKDGNLAGLVQMFGGADQALGGAIRYGADYLAGNVDWLASRTGLLGRAILSPLSSGLRFASGFVCKVADGIGEGSARFASGFGQLMRGNIGGGLRDIASGAWNAAKSVVNAVGGASKSVGEAVGGFFKSIFSGW